MKQDETDRITFLERENGELRSAVLKLISTTEQLLPLYADSFRDRSIQECVGAIKYARDVYNNGAAVESLDPEARR